MTEERIIYKRVPEFGIEVSQQMSNGLIRVIRIRSLRNEFNGNKTEEAEI